MNVAIAGPGLMGSQIGVEYALGGHHVAFVARNLDRGMDRVNAAFEVARSLQIWTDQEIEAAHAQVVFVPVVTDLNSATDLFIESIIEDPQVKIDLLKAASIHLPGATLLSNTSSLSIGRLGGWAGAPKRTLGTHYWNPPLLMPLVEVVAGPKTDLALVDQVIEVLQDLGKRPVFIRHDVDGFVWNRLQMALLREAVWIVEQGIAEPAVVDEIVRDGLARRWRYTGPFETAALGGPQTFTKVANNLWPELSHASLVKDLGRWLIDDPEVLRALRLKRDAGLIDDLKADRQQMTEAAKKTDAGE